MQIEFQNELRGAGTRSLKIDRRIAVPAIQAPCAMQHSHSGWCNRTHSADLRAPTLTTNNVESTVHLGACREFGHKRFGQRSAIASQLRRSGHDHESLWTGRLQSASECDIRVLDDFRCRGRVVPPSLRNCLRIDGQLKWVTGNDYSVRSRTGKEAKHVLPLLLAGKGDDPYAATPLECTAEVCNQLRRRRGIVSAVKHDGRGAWKDFTAGCKLHLTEQPSDLSRADFRHQSPAPQNVVGRQRL